MTDDTAYVDFARSQIQYLVDQGREVDGTWLVPQFHHDGGWDRFGPMHARFTSHLWCLSQDPGDAELAVRLRLGMRRFVNTPSYAFPDLSGASG